MHVIFVCVLMTQLAELISASAIMTAFLRTTDSRNPVTFSTTTVRSSEDCCYMCITTSGCSLANYHQLTRSCELGSLSGNYISATGWDLFLLKDQRCSKGWKRHNDSCFMLSKQLLTWNDAGVACGAFMLNGHLATIKNQDVNDFLQTTYSAEIGSSYIWIGGSKNEVGDFIWVDEVPMIGFWAPLQPDNYDGDEACVHIYPDFTWNDNACNKTMWILCAYTLV